MSPDGATPLQALGNDRRDAGPTAAAEGPRATFEVVAELGRDPRRPLRRPLLLAVAADGRLVVLDRPEADRFRLAFYSPAGAPEGVEAVFTRGAADPELLAPSGLAVDGAHAVYVSDAVQGCVKKFAANGCWVATYRCTPRLDGPRGVAVGPGGCLYVADTNNNRVVQLSPDGEPGWVLERFAAREGGEGEEELYEPGSVCGDGGLLWVADTNNNRVLAFDAGRRLVRALGGDDLFDFPSAVRAAPSGEALYVADRGNLRVRRFDPQGACTGELVLDPERAGSAGGDVAVDGEGRVLALDPLREVVFVLAFAGALT